MLTFLRFEPLEEQGIRFMKLIQLLNNLNFNIEANKKERLNGMLYQFIVYSNKNKRMLFDNDDGQLSFPSFYSKLSHIADIKGINEYFHKHYWLHTHILRCWKKEKTRIVYEVEVLDNNLPFNSKFIDWINPSNPNILSHIKFHEHWILRKWRDTETYYLPWSRYDFRNKIEKWIESILSDDYDTIVQVRTWEKGMLMKVYGHDDNYYVKTVPAIFNHEPYIHQSLPRFVPEVISISENNNTYMMKEIKGKLLGYRNDIRLWEKTARRIAKLQKWFVNNELNSKITIPKRSIHTVLTEKNIKDTIKKLHNYTSDENTQNLLSSISSILILVESLKYKTLSTIDHGDLFGGNVMVENDEPLIYDWSNSAISHPFLSIVRLVEEVSIYFSEGFSNKVLDSYLDEWKDCDKSIDLNKEFTSIQLLEPIYYLTVHMLIIFPAFQYNSDKKEIIDSYVSNWLNNINKMNDT